MKTISKTLIYKNGKARWFSGVLKQETLDKLNPECAYTYKIDKHNPSKGFFDKQKVWG